jgi:hypothetical protein
MDLKVIECMGVGLIQLNITVFWDVTPCNLVDRYRRFRGTCLFCLQNFSALKLEAAGTCLPNCTASYDGSLILVLTAVRTEVLQWGRGVAVITVMGPLSSAKAGISRLSEQLLTFE